MSSTDTMTTHAGMPEIYGNDSNLALIRHMRQRMPHACLFYGAAGTGRKTLAMYFAMTAFCTGTNAPCGVCPDCRKLLHGSHPDLLFVEHSGKKQGFSVDTIRAVCQDALIAPNDSTSKIYLFTDCDAISIPAQNTLLKLTEEPPAHVKLCFTAEKKTAFLDTMLSRMMQIAVKPCTEAACRAALCKQGKPPARAEAAAAACNGNIGMALAWLEDKNMQALTGQIAAFTHALTSRDNYTILKILHTYEKDRQQAAAFLKLLDLQIRDALVAKYGVQAFRGCDRDSVQRLAAVLSLRRAVILQEAVRNASQAIAANISVKLAFAAMAGQIFQSV